MACDSTRFPRRDPGVRGKALSGLRIEFHLTAFVGSGCSICRRWPVGNKRSSDWLGAHLYKSIVFFFSCATRTYDVNVFSLTCAANLTTLCGLVTRQSAEVEVRSLHRIHRDAALS